MKGAVIEMIEYPKSYYGHKQRMGESRKVACISMGKGGGAHYIIKVLCAFEPPEYSIVHDI